VVESHSCTILNTLPQTVVMQAYHRYEIEINGVYFSKAPQKHGRMTTKRRRNSKANTSQDNQPLGVPSALTVRRPTWFGRGCSFEQNSAAATHHGDEYWHVSATCRTTMGVHHAPPPRDGLVIRSEIAFRRDGRLNYRRQECV
jgi:hypothetical protein